MDASPSRTGAGTSSQPATTARPGRRQARQRRAASAASSGAFTPPARADARIQAVERNLAGVYGRFRAAGVDLGQLDTGFAVLGDVIAEIKALNGQAQRELAPVPHEWDQARRQPPNLGQYSGQSDPVLPDMPGFDLCPDPSTVQTSAGFMDCLRRYRIWSGQVSYREMERKCGRRFAASTICTALQGDDLPSFDMTLAIVVACGGSEEHQLSFLSAWRRIQMQDAGQPPARP